jgi:hypothetical protein
MQPSNASLNELLLSEKRMGLFFVRNIFIHNGVGAAFLAAFEPRVIRRRRG